MAETKDIWESSIDTDERELLHMDDVLDRPVLVEGFEEREGVFGKYYTIYIDGKYVVNTGSADIMSKLEVASLTAVFPKKGKFLKKDLPDGRRVYLLVPA